MTRVLFVHAGERMSSFVARDHEMLAKHFEVTTLRWTRAADALALRRALRDHDCAFTWFLGHHAAACAVAARMAGKPSIAVLGGVEPASAEVQGVARIRRRDAWAVAKALNDSALVLAVSRFTLGEARPLLRKGARSALRVLHNGVDTGHFRPAGSKEDLVLTVSQLDASTAFRKRVALFVEAARAAPDLRFGLVGAEVDATAQALRARAAPNLTMHGEVPDTELLRLYQRARVYVQPSLHESFGMANAEAMACGCVPVVARRGALPEVVGNAGVVLDEPLDAAALAEGVRRAHASGLGAAARARIEQRFNLRQREEGLVRAVEDAVQGRLKPGVEEP